MANDIYLKSKTGVKKYPKTYSRNIIDKDTTLQDKLVSGTNIKTVGSTSILGSGDIPMPTVDQTYSASSTNAQSGVAVASAVSGKQDTLVSGTNIKTINNTSILGSGDITISGGGSIYQHYVHITGGTTDDDIYIMFYSTSSSMVTSSTLLYNVYETGIKLIPIKVTRNASEIVTTNKVVVSSNLLMSFEQLVINQSSSSHTIDTETFSVGSGLVTLNNYTFTDTVIEL